MERTAILGGVRTPFSKVGGALSPLNVPGLGEGEGLTIIYSGGQGTIVLVEV